MFCFWLHGSLVPRVCFLPRESTLVRAGHVFSQTRSQGLSCFVFGFTATSFPGSSLYLEKLPWLRLVTCVPRENEVTEREAPSPGLGICHMPETAGVHFLLRPHHYILKVITQFRKCRPRANTSMEASFTGYIRKKWYFWMDKSKRDIYIFTTCWE